MKKLIGCWLIALSLLPLGCATHPRETSKPGGTSGAWAVIGKGAGKWDNSEGVITAHSDTGDSILASSQTYTNCTVSAIVSTTNREASLAVRLQDSANGYIIIFLPDGISWNQGVGGIWVAKRTNYDEKYIGHYHARGFPGLGQPAKLSVNAAGSSIKVSLNNMEVIQVSDSSYSSGHVGLRIDGDAALPCDAKFSDVDVK